MIMSKKKTCWACHKEYIQGCLVKGPRGMCNKCSEDLEKMTKYQRLQYDLSSKGEGSMKCFGSSMTPILQSGSTLTFVKQESYEVGDIVFCKVNGRYIDAHKITKIGQDGRYMISNNHGHENGWTSTIYGKAVKIEYKGNIKEL